LFQAASSSLRVLFFMNVRTWLIAAMALVGAVPALAAGPSDLGKLDAPLQRRAAAPTGSSRVIIRTRDGRGADALVRAVKGTPGRQLAALGGQLAEVPDSALVALASSAHVDRVSLDRPVVATMERTSATIGASWVRQNLGYDGRGVGIAVVDSGVTAWHDDLTDDVVTSGEPGGVPTVTISQRVVHFVDFVNQLPSAYDDFGHGTHVAGIIAGNGYDSSGARAGVAPGARLVALKVLDSSGRGYIGDVLAAIDYAIAHRDEFNIRVLNLSVAAGVYESYQTDPLTVAARRAVEAGIVVVTAAGNLGRNAQGATQYGGITAPGNAPWVLTVGASSHMGTVARADDSVARFSSRGPSYFDHAAKPDLVAPGVGLASLSDPGSALYAVHPEWRLGGTVPTWYLPYFALTGTSMASPVVSGTVALMLQANPSLTPNAVKAILQYTAQTYPGFRPLAQGAGFLNARGAVHLAELFAGRAKTAVVESDEATWSKRIVWGNHRLGGGVIRPDANAWDPDVVWGSARDGEGDNIVWGTGCVTASCDNIVWGTAAEADNIVWGTSADGDNIVWGTGSDENIVWGTECGGADCENIVWGSLCDAAGCDNIVWGTAQPGDSIVWGTSGRDHIVWGASGGLDNIVWGTLLVGDNIVWGASEAGSSTTAATTSPDPATSTPGKKGK
jgi:serine protease AprX